MRANARACAPMRGPSVRSGLSAVSAGPAFATPPAEGLVNSSVRKGTHALVIGGGIGGLAAAGVLARRFDRVTVLERDAYPDGSEVRAHAPQGAHAHILLAGGLVALTRLVPHLPQWLDEMGLPERDLTVHTRVAYEGVWLPSAVSGVPVRACSRQDVERLLLRDVRARGNVALRPGVLVTGYLGDRGRVTGVRLGSGEELSADLVVDASGRATASHDWLEALGVPPAPIEVVDAKVTYASCWFEPKAPIQGDWVITATLPAIPSCPRMGVVLRAADGRLLVSAVSYGNTQVPRTPVDVVAHFEHVGAPELHALLADARPVSDVALYGNTRNRLRRYAKVRPWPDGVVVLGDAVCSLNPRYGQGMTVASLGVDVLDRAFDTWRRPDLTGFGASYQRRLEARLTVPWQTALLEDRSWAALESGGGGILDAAAQYVVRKLLRTAFTDIGTYIRFMRVAHLLDHPVAMLNVRTIAKLVFGGGTLALPDPSAPAHSAPPPGLGARRPVNEG